MCAPQVGSELTIRMPLDAGDLAAAQAALHLRPGNRDAGKILAWIIYLESYKVRSRRSDKCGAGPCCEYV